jgi:isoleucyl-tRNA synthetase
VAADFVSMEEGTGIVHMAPAFGADDLALGKEEDLPIIHTVDDKGAFIDQVTPWRGLFVKDADPLIIEDLQRRGLMYRVGTYEHVYPFCWRCETPLLYYAKTSWFIETTRLKEELLENNRKINWYPPHIRDGRFGNWLENNVDWALGRERYWGTPLPIWECSSCGEQECVGSVEELSRWAGRDLSGLDLHRPYVDEVIFYCRECQGVMRRVPEVLDAWFDSGAMPVAQWHYPFQNQELFAEQFPADFISEAVDQTRGWFYTLHALSTLLFGLISYRNVICLGLVLDAEGVKMSKSRGNVVDPWEVLNEHGADAVRWYLYSTSPPGNDRRFSAELVGEVVRKFFLTLWNTHSFFSTYARLDRFQPDTTFLPVGERPSLDRWIVAELNRLVEGVDRDLSNYNATGAARRIEEFVDVLSNWYVRRSRRRFWKGEQDWDKAAAYLTLYECLVALAKLMAPLAPFTSEEIYRTLVASWDSSAPESVHLADFPQADPALMDEQLVADTRLVMRLASLGRSARNRAGIRLRQPLRTAWVLVREEEEKPGVERLAAQLLDELNVKEVEFVQDPAELVGYRVRPVAATVGPKYGSLFPAIVQALAEGDAGEFARKVRQGQVVELDIEGEQIHISPEEIEVDIEPQEGLSLAEEAGYMVAVTTTLDQELLQEGLAREVVRRIQNMRKSAGLRIEDYIITRHRADPELAEVIELHSDYIQRETLSRELTTQEMALRGYGEELQIGEYSLYLEITKAG